MGFLPDPSPSRNFPPRPIQRHSTQYPSRAAAGPRCYVRFPLLGSWSFVPCFAPFFPLLVELGSDDQLWSTISVAVMILAVCCLWYRWCFAIDLGSPSLLISSTLSVVHRWHPLGCYLAWVVVLVWLLACSLSWFGWWWLGENFNSWCRWSIILDLSSKLPLILPLLWVRRAFVLLRLFCWFGCWLPCCLGLVDDDLGEISILDAFWLVG